jgi:large subunit ribosomal protein L21
VKLDYRAGEIGSRVELPRVLLYTSGETLHVGQPTIDGARIIAEVVEHPSTKYYIQHFRRRKNYRRFKGHRQPYTSVRIRNILLAGQEPPPAPAPTPAPAPAPSAS